VDKTMAEIIAEITKGSEVQYDNLGTN
jgi:hypothetical protein